LIVQLAPPSRVVGQSLDATMKSPLELPETIGATPPVGDCPSLRRVIVAVALAPTAVSPKSCASGTSVIRGGASAVPENAAMAIAHEPSLTVKVAGLGPAGSAAAGANRTTMVQLAPAASAVPAQSPETA